MNILNIIIGLIAILIVIFTIKKGMQIENNSIVYRTLIDFELNNKIINQKENIFEKYIKRRKYLLKKITNEYINYLLLNNDFIKKEKIFNKYKYYIFVEGVINNWLVNLKNRNNNLYLKLLEKEDKN